MKRRWIILLGRIGTVFVAMGFALILLSLIPPVKDQGTDFIEMINLQPQTFSIADPFFLSYPLDPQHGLSVNARANHTVKLYLLSVGRTYVEEWIVRRLSDTQQSVSTLNASLLEEFLKSHQSLVAWQEDTMNGKVEVQYVPTKIVNMTLIFSNWSVQNAHINYSIHLLRVIVSSERALNPAKFLVPLGIALTLPWLNFLMKRRRTYLRIFRSQIIQRPQMKTYDRKKVNLIVVSAALVY